MDKKGIVDYADDKALSGFEDLCWMVQIFIIPFLPTHVSDLRDFTDETSLRRTPNNK